ncbi:hypothetical protein Taro_034679 [Colocasia esculenta]|uniref:non-specific serine/threonine protein kinase n=1 Tax=Colocasia esculenta TaxID=4460 RepID=A0A843VYD2_COLES|nr:hypothetical protein [Colocasia esculenta]
MHVEVPGGRAWVALLFLHPHRLLSASPPCVAGRRRRLPTLPTPGAEMVQSGRHSLLLFLSVAATFLLPLAFSISSVPASTLLAFRRSLPRPSQLLLPWPDRGNRTGAASHCRWPGVSCFRRSPAVRSLDLSGVGLDGSLSAAVPHLCELPSLFHLDLGSNRFSGPISPRLGNCSHLRVLLLNGNRLTGAIPPEIFGPLLRSIDLGDNSLTGGIPAEVRFSVGLVFAGFYNNFLNGELPEELFHLPSLQSLYLNTNNLTGKLPDFPSNCAISQLWIHENLLSGHLPRSLINCHGLSELYASENKFEGMIPDIFSGLPALETLYLNDNRFVGGLPRSLGNHGNLSLLVLSGNGLNGTITEELGGCRHLKVLNMGQNNLEGPVPPSIGNLTELNFLYLYQNMLVGTIPAELGNCVSLIDLRLQDNFLEGVIPPEIFSLEKLEILYLFNNSLEGGISREIGRLSSLVELQLYSNKLSGGIPEEITHLRNLSDLSLAHNNLVGELPSDLGKTTFTGLVEVDLTGNILYGRVPQGLCTGNQLTVLDLGSNRFNGSFPVEMAQCASLDRVILSNNHLQGNLPLNMGQNQGISYLDIRGNLLQGQIPQILGSWYNLSMLDMSDNLFSGPIPREFGNLKNLEVLHLSNNKLTGVIPSELGNCVKLIRLDLSRNILSGAISNKIIGLINLQNLLLQENKLTGEIPNSFTSQQNLFELQLGGNLLEGSLPRSLGNLQHFSLILKLSNNRLTGDIPASFGSLDQLQVLDLSNNSLSGEIPSVLGNMISLSSINVSFNQLGGKLPNCWMKFVTSSPESFTGNNFCIQDNGRNSCNETSKQHSHKIKKRVVLTLLFCVIIFLLGLCIVLFLVFRNSRNSVPCKVLTRSVGSNKDLPEDLNIEDLMKVTEDWSEKYMLGKGRHGTVYRMESGIGKHWAVKKVDLSEGSFSLEVNILSIAKHRNIIRMAGYCIKDEFGFIIYELMSGGTLFEVLHQKKEPIVLDWEVRYNIALGIAHGLAYLHHDCVPQIIHRDIKSDNILMDSELTPKIGDFGTAKMVDGSDSGLTMTSIIGTLGYIAPENGFSTRVSEKSDVYSYGVVMLELLCRKMPVDPSFEDGVDIVTWTKMNMEERGDERSPFCFLDEEIGWWLEQEKAKAVELLQLALACTQLSCEARPSMREVVKSLAKLK